MANISKFEKLTHVQLQQKVIHLESELSFVRTNRETHDRKYLERLQMVQQENERLKFKVQEVLNENVMYNQERDGLIKDYNELLLKNTDDQNKILQLERRIGLGDFDEKIERLSYENGNLVKMAEDLRKEADLLREDAEKHVKEKQISEAEMERLREELSHLEEANEEMNRIIIKDRDLVQDYKLQITALNKEIEDKKQIYLEKKATEESIAELQKQLMEKETAFSMQMKELEANLTESKKQICQINKEKTDLEQELEKENFVLNDTKMQNQKMEQDLQVLKQKNVAYLQKITQLEDDQKAARELENQLKTEISNVKSQLMEVEKVRTEMLGRLKEREDEVGKLQEENNQFVEEKTVLLNKFAQLQQELTQSENECNMYQEKETAFIMQMKEIEADLTESKEKICQINKEKTDLEQELEKNNIVLNNTTIQNQKMEQDLQVLKEKNVS